MESPCNRPCRNSLRREPPYPQQAPSSPSRPRTPIVPARADPCVQGGTFQLNVTLPNEYPFKPPVLNFATKIYHPNVTNDDKGSMCLGLLRPDTWKPASKLLDVLVFTMGVLEIPDPDDAVEQGIAAEFKDNRSAWEKKAREWTKTYAKAS